MSTLPRSVPGSHSGMAFASSTPRAWRRSPATSSPARETSLPSKETHMLLRNRRLLTALALVTATLARAEVPAGWLLSSRVRTDYEVGIDKAETHAGKPVAYLRSRVAEPTDFATLMQTFDADRYRGKRVRLSA